MNIRDAVTDDAAGIAHIYNDAVAHTTAIWNTTLVDIDDRRNWLTERQRAGFPVLVAVDGDEVLGYATYGPYRPYDGFRLTVEHSIYVRDGLRGKGIGGSLLAELIARARAARLHVIVAGIDAANSGSIRLHERYGFSQVGLLKEVGTKFGSWRDLAFLQLTLDRADPTADPNEATGDRHTGQAERAANDTQHGGDLAEQ
ncbi:MAG: GNAT family N-acetyltransferase [Gordonia sp. (in: high G+C Gram-positive bacteria)]